VTSTSTLNTTIPAQRAEREPEGLETWPLVEAAQAGDAEAFAELFRLYRDQVFRAVFSRVGRDRPVADDIVSTTFLRAWCSIGRLTYMGRDYGAVLNTISRNLIADHFKGAAVRLRVSNPRDPAGDEILSESVGEPLWLDRPAEVSRHAERADLRRAVEAALELLTPDQARVIRLRYLDEMSVGETAALEGKSPGAIKATTLRAIRALRSSGALDGHR
jgi:RNA polymerase sigma-70 factor (ECF subfamily)